MPTDWKDIAITFRSLDRQFDVPHQICHNQVIFKPHGYKNTESFFFLKFLIPNMYIPPTHSSYP